ncbi:MAG: NAD-dependent epimerase/dehydratase family protein [Spirochaetes bacterium]|nr:NAD-dependent epimerase/dehydratase family protein [Spirochaetota bacterium]
MYDLSAKRVLVTGATGLIGSAVIRRLLAGGSTVRALVRDPTRARGLLGAGVDIAPGDMTDPTRLRSVVQGCHAVFHFAAVLNEFQPPQFYRSVNVEGTRSLAEAALAAGVERFLHASSVAVYGLRASGRIDESSPRVPCGDSYGDTKIEAEELIRRMAAERGLPAVIVQPTQVYGAGDRAWTSRPIELIRAHRMLMVDGGRGLVSPIYIDDLADGVLAAAGAGRPGQSYILRGPATISIREFFEAYARMLGSEDRFPSVPAWLAIGLAGLSEAAARRRGGKPVFTRVEILRSARRADFDGTRARDELGFTARVTLEDGMRGVERWLHSLEQPPRPQ